MSFKEKLKDFVKKYHYTKEEVNLKISNINSEVSNINSEVSTVQTNMNEIQSMFFIDINIDNPILSYIESGPQTATLTATLYPILKNKTIEIYKNDILVDTQQTDLKGQVSYIYTAEGAGDIEIKFKYSFITSACNVEDCQYYNNGSNVKGLTIPNDVNCTSNGEYITIDSSNNQYYITLPSVVNSQQSFIFEVELAQFDSNSALIIYPTIGSKPFIDVYSSDVINYNPCGEKSDNQLHGTNIVKAGDKFKIKWNAIEHRLYMIQNNRIFGNCSGLSPTYNLRFCTTNKNQYIKNIKIKKI